MYDVSTTQKVFHSW